MRPTLALLAVLLAAGCSGDTRPERLSLADLQRFAERYDEARVVTSGVVHGHDDPEHYWIQDDALNRVAIEPKARIADRVGEHVRVVGRFHYSRDRGRRIEAERVTAADD